MKPLAGLLVADFSRVLAGPMASMMLADLGATVIKVERAGTGDDTRSWGPPFTDRATAYFESVNRGKASVVLDLDDPAERAAAVRLAGRADVLIENFGPGRLTSRGLDYTSVRAANPGIVYCSISGFGPGAGAALPGYDFIVQAVGGLMSITGAAEPAGEPTKVGVACVDVLTGKDAVIGIQAALAVRAQTGEGQLVEVNLLSSLLGGLVNQAANASLGYEPRRLGNQHPSIAPYETLQCADGVLAVACGNDLQFARLTAAIGVPALSEDPRFRRNPDRVANRETLVEALEQALSRDIVAAWVECLADADVAVGAVGTVNDGLDLAERLGLAPLFSPGVGYLPQVRHPVSYSGFEATVRLPPPDLGAHTNEVLAWLNGPDDAPLPAFDSPTHLNRPEGP